MAATTCSPAYGCPSARIAPESTSGSSVNTSANSRPLTLTCATVSLAVSRVDAGEPWTLTTYWPACRGVNVTVAEPASFVTTVETVDVPSGRLMRTTCWASPTGS
jgi:hypothetical protein